MNNIDNLINNASSQAQQQAQEQNTQQNMQQQHTNTQQNTQEYIPSDQGQNGQVYDQGGAQQQNMQQQNMQQQNMQQQNMQQQNMQQQNMQQQNMQQQNMQQQNMQQQNMQQQNMQQNPNMQQQNMQHNPNMQQQNMQQNPMMQQQNMQQQNMQQNPMMQQQNQMVPQQNQMMPQQNPVPNLPAHMQQYAMPSDMSMESLDAMGLQVDHWLKPDYVGMTVGETPSIVDHIIAEIDLTQNVGFVTGFGLRYGKNPPNYDFTQDGLTSVKTGAPWLQSLATAMSVDPQANPYRSAQLMFTALEAVKSQDGSLLVDVGETVGYTTPQSNWAEWSKFYRNCSKAGLVNKTVKVKLTNIPRTKDSNKWGVVKIELLENAVSQSAA